MLFHKRVPRNFIESMPNMMLFAGGICNRSFVLRSYLVSFLTEHSCMNDGLVQLSVSSKVSSVSSKVFLAVSSKVSRGVGFLRHAKSFLPKETLQTLYTGIVEPHFRHCCSVWGCAALTEINQLQKLQNRAARIITNSSFDAPGGPLIEEMGWKTIDELITCESKTKVFKSLNQLAPEYLCGLFTRNSLCSSYSLRNTGTDLRLPKKRSSNGQRCFSYRGAKLWNGLSAESKQATSLYSFKKTIKKVIPFILILVLNFSLHCK